MLKLAVATEPAWLDRALADLDAVLLDHAHAEKKAAATAVNLMFRYPEHPLLLRPLSELAREELAHFERLLACLEARGLRFERQKPSPYAGRLLRVVRAEEPGRLVDTLLCCAAIEARSCERFRLLARALAGPEPELAALYRELWAAEAGHAAAYVDLAREVAGAEPVRQRLPEVLAHEARVLSEAPPWPRLHC